MNIKIFSPQGIKPEDYRHRFPELERTKEFDNLPSRQLIFIWWYANQSSPLVLDEHDNYERVKGALARSGFNPGKVERERLLSLQFDSAMASAIKRMSEFDPGARFKSYLMVKKIFDQYQFIVDQGPEAFKESTTKGEGENKIITEEVDYKKYVDISAKIAGELPELLVRLEEGFAVVNVSGEITTEDESSALRDWQQQKDNI
jgi:hypothetical protein